jgi:hypothetical protein
MTGRASRHRYLQQQPGGVPFGELRRERARSGRATDPEPPVCPARWGFSPGASTGTGDRTAQIHASAAVLLFLDPLRATACPGGIVAAGVENEYTAVIRQVGGKYVQVSTLMSNPNTDPRTFKVGASVAQMVNSALLAVQNGVGYDTFEHGVSVKTCHQNL